MTMAVACPEPVEGVVVIEHNLDVIKTADHIVDLGPDGGVRGGEIVAAGTPEEVAQVERSFTGAYLKPMLEKGGAAREAAE
ncbi:MAG: excinuclease ABC subunit A [Pseudomonadota bacterium]